MGSERRADPRFSGHFDVRFSRALDAAKALSAFSVNFSAGGLCLKAVGTYALGESLQLSLTIEENVFQLEGVVAWIRGGAVGVRFVNVTPQTRHQLEETARLMAKKTPPLT